MRLYELFICSIYLYICKYVLQGAIIGSISSVILTFWLGVKQFIQPHNLIRLITEHVKEKIAIIICFSFQQRGCRGHDRMVVEYTTTYAISVYYH
jgi:hypothetical protein